MTSSNIDEEAKEARILVEFERQPGAFDVALSSPEDVARKSAEALDSAMDTIHNMARRVIATVDALPHRPTQAAVTFGIKLTAEAGALITKAGVEATINVTLTMEGKGTDREQTTS